jgi:CubicO group peptidase (beta-lactamase class C family)
MKRNSYLPVIAIIIFIVCSCTQSPVLHEGSPSSVKVSAGRLNRIDNILKQSIDSGWIAGAVAFIARDGKIVYNKSFGYNDPETKAPMKSDIIFRIASQSKAITSVAAMMLFEEGKFLLDDPISKYIPEFSKPVVLDTYNEKDTTFTTIPAKREITVRDLLTHTSGIDYANIGSAKMIAIYNKAGIPVGFESRHLLLADAIKKLGKLPLVHQPGEGFTYGLNADVLGYLVEVLSGMSFDRFLKERLFMPLGMNDSYFYIPKEKQARIATVFTEKNHHVEKWTEQTVPAFSANYPLAEGTYFSGGAGLSSTIKDYAIFLQMLLNGGVYDGKRILARRTVELMTMNQIGNLSLGDGPNKFGLGFEITTKTGEAKLGVTEGSFSWGGFFGTTYWVDPKEHLVCLVYVQQWPLSHDPGNKFRALVYQSLED